LAVVLQQIRKYDVEKRELDNTLTLEQEKLLNEFELLTRKMLLEYDEAWKPHAKTLTELMKPLQTLLEGRYIVIDAAVVDALAKHPKWSYGGTQESSNGNSAFGRSSGELPGLDSSTRISNKLAPKGTFLSYIGTVRNKLRREAEEKEARERFERERLEKEEKERAETEKRTELAINSILPMFGHLTLEEAGEALRRNGDDVPATVNWMLNQDMSTLSSVLQPPAKPTASSTNSSTAPKKNHGLAAAMASASASSARSVHGGNSNSDSDEQKNGAGTLNFSQLKPSGKSITLRITAVRKDLTIQIKTMLDRNSVPCDMFAPRTYSLPIDALVGAPSIFRLADGKSVAEIEETRKGGIPVITYQVLEGDEFCPIRIDPPIPLAEYKIEWSPYTKSIKTVNHKKDGAVLYSAVEDTGKGISFADDHTPLEVFSQSSQAGSYNIVHMHLNDTRGDIAIAGVDLTGSDKTVADCMDLDKDSSGRELTYKVVVKDGKVSSVLHRFGDEVKACVYRELSIPSVGEHVAFTESQTNSSSVSIGRVDSVPLGMLIAAAKSTASVDDDTKEDVDVVDCSSYSVHPTLVCSCRHPEDLLGYINVAVLLSDEKLNSEPQLMSIPVCCVRTASPDDLNLLTVARESEDSRNIASLHSNLAALEEALRDKDNCGKSISDLDTLRVTIVDLQANSCVAEKLTSTDTERITRALASLRGLALSKRLGK